MRYSINQLTSLLGLKSTNDTIFIVSADGLHSIFEEYRGAIGTNTASPQFHLNHVIRLLELSDHAPESSWAWTGEEPKKEGWTADYHAARFVWRADRWVESINGGWVRSRDRRREIERLCGVLWYMHEMYIGYMGSRSSRRS
jgi:hypothetical protein